MTGIKFKIIEKILSVELLKKTLNRKLKNLIFFLMKKTKLLSYGILLILLFAVSFVKAATVTCLATGLWGNGAIWSSGVAPTPGADVIIGGGFTVTVNVTTNAVKTITLGTAAGAGTLDFGSNAGYPWLVNVTGLVTLGSGGNAGNVILENGGKLTCGGFTYTSGTWNPADGTVEINTGSNVTLPSTVITTFNNLIINVSSSKTVTASANLTLTGNLVITSGTFATGTFTCNIAGNITNSPSASTFTSTTGTINCNGPGDQTISAGATATTTLFNITNSNTAGTVIFNTIGAIAINGTLYAISGSQTSIQSNGVTAANLTLENNAELIEGVGFTLNVTNPATIMRTMGGINAWHYFCYPVTVSNTKFFLTSPPSNYVKWYDEPNNVFHYIGTIQPDSGYSNKPAYGYALWANTSTSYSFTGTVNNGVISTTVTRSLPANLLGDHNGWNLVGNPYPSAIDLSSFSLMTSDWVNLEPWAYFWHPGADSPNYTGGNYDVFGAGATIPPNGTTHTQFVPAMQGFFVKVTATGNQTTGTYHIDNQHRVFNSEAWLKEQQSGGDFVKVKATSLVNGSTDQVSVYFNQATSVGYNENEDAQKLTGSDGAPQLYTTAEGTNLTIQGLPILEEQGTQIVPMGFTCTLPGSYTLTATDIESFSDGVGVSLQDLKTNTTQDLRTNPVYNFDYVTSDSPDHFLLIFSELNTGTNDHHSIANLNIYSYNGSIYVGQLSNWNNGGTIIVYDIMGKEIFKSALENTSLNKFSVNVSEGYYIVKVITRDQTINRKVYLN